MSQNITESSVPEHLYSEFEVSQETAIELGLTKDEYALILGILERKPTYTELGMYSVLWSEHCSYKNSIKQLKTLPRSGGRMLVEAGEENAGLIDIGNGYAIAFKIESHNHPSAIEPYQGAATGVGGILRDIFTMGARPIAALNSLRFGTLTDERTKYLLKGVVKGIGDYGNSFGVPTVGGEVYFEDCYADNPLVNAMAVGIVKVGQTASAIATGVGNPVMILGSRTGRDGIHGASLLASREFDESTEEMRPTVQVGDPFAEKILLEATLELIAAGVVVGVQDMGAAGICCSTAEMSEKGNAGMRINLDKVPLREQEMSAYEILLSESQERMLVVLQKGREEEAQAICQKWDVPMTHIGEVTDTGLLEMFREGKQVTSVPAHSLVLGGGAPVYDREWREADYYKKMQAFVPEDLPENIPHEEAFWALLSAPTIASKRWVYEQYDSQVRTNTVRRAEADAAILRLKELPGQGIAVCTDCNSRYVYLDPYVGGKIAVAEAARNVVCTGAEPVAITNCLNFGNPYDPQVYWQFREVIRGMGDACRQLNTPVTGGNVSFHNESRANAIYPTPTIGMLGLIDNLEHSTGSGFTKVGDLIMVIGPDRRELGGSEYVKQLHNIISGAAPELDLEEEQRLQTAILTAIRQGLVHSAHDCAEGGLSICLAEKAIHSQGNLGAEIDLQENISAGLLFGESQSRVVISVAPEHQEAVQNICQTNQIPCKLIGTVVPNTFTIKDSLATNVERLREVFHNALPTLVNS